MIKRVVDCVSPILTRALSGTAIALVLAGTTAAAPPTIQIAQAGSIVTLQSPRIADYWMSATRQPGGVIVFDGYVPDEATRSRLSTVPNADTNYLKLGSGAPERYQAAVDFALLLLDNLSEGRVSLRGTTLTIEGNASSSAAYAKLVEAIAAGTPEGVNVTPGEIKAPPATAYAWSASKAADGTVALSGMVPDAATSTALAATEAHPSVTALTYASGEPPEFLASATLALSLLQYLQAGTAAYNGAAWTVSGIAADPAAKAALDADFAGRKLAGAGWSLDVSVAAAPAKPEPVAPATLKPQPTPATEPAPPAVPAEPPAPEAPAAAPPEQPAVEPAPAPAPAAIDPAYAFSATRAADGSVTLTGQLPAEPALRFFGVITGAATDGVTIAAGAPQDFTRNAQAGIRALMELDDAQLRFANGAWSLSGKAADTAEGEAIKASIAALPAGASWSLDITVPPALDACQADVATFSNRNAILFQSGAAVIATESEPALDELAGYLAKCPEADIDIEGHTDADGDDAQNLALSVARAEAVVNALIARNIGAERLYAIGYGESTPIADNDTSAGKRLNRRIVVKVLQHHVD